ncbi:Protein CHUP1, chloroplastic [Hordeum vulgare]|nr:Protein CHUP1, chloroplastic [Hordeum vulgare]
MYVHTSTAFQGEKEEEEEEEVKTISGIINSAPLVDDDEDDMFSEIECLLGGEIDIPIPGDGFERSRYNAYMANNAAEMERLRDLVRELEEREVKLEGELLKYYGLKEQQIDVSELQKQLKITTVEVDMLNITISSLQAKRKKLQEDVARDAAAKKELACEDGKNADLAGILEELKENNNRSSLNSSSLKDEKRQKNRSRGKENNSHVHNTSTSHHLSLPTSTCTSGLTSMVTENHTEAPKCTGLRLKKNLDEVSLTNSFTVVNAEITDGGNLNVDSTIQKNRDEVLRGSLKEKEDDNVTTSLGSCMLDSSQLASRNVSLMRVQTVIVDADVKTDFLHSSTEEKVYQSAVSEDVTIPSGLVSQPNISEEHMNFGSGNHTREDILRTSFNSARIEKVLPSGDQKNQSYPFNEGANFFQTGNTDPNFRADVHHRRNIYGSGGMENSEYEFQRNNLQFVI